MCGPTTLTTAVRHRRPGQLGRRLGETALLEEVDNLAQPSSRPRRPPRHPVTRDIDIAATLLLPAAWGPSWLAETIAAQAGEAADNVRVHLGEHTRHCPG